MRNIKRWTLIGILAVGIMGVGSLPTLANCDDGTPGDDIMNCDTDLPQGQSLDGDVGSDTITIDSGVTVGEVGGDSRGTMNNGAGQAGDDVITNNGTIVTNILGDFSDSVQAGNDIITNNGTMGGSIYGDYQGIIITTGGDDTIVNTGTMGGGIYGDYFVGNGGNDTIVNNGVVTGPIAGDSNDGPLGGGDDKITNNGSAYSNVVGDYGSDVIVNNGVISGSIFGDTSSIDMGGDDTITNSGNVGGDIDAGAGNDTVTLAVGSSVGGTVTGGNGTDTLIFSGETTDSAGYDQIQSMLGCNPCAGTVTLDGRIYTFDSFEALKSLLILLAKSGAPSVDIHIAERVNGSENGAPFALYCTSNTIIVMDIGANSQGIGEFHYSLSSLPPAGDEPIVLASGEGNQLILQPDGTLLAVGASLDGTKTYVLHFTTDCQSLSAGQEA
jgi:hypothetical protein